MSKRVTTKYTGIFYRESITNSKSDKTYYITYKDKNNKSKEKKIGKHSEGIRLDYCKAIRDKAISDIRLGNDNTILKSSKKVVVTFNDIALDFLENKQLHIKDIKHYISRYNKHIKDVIGNMDIDNIETKDIEKLQHIKIKKLSPKTVNHITDLISTIFNYAIDNGRFNTINPSRKIKRFKVDNKRNRFLNSDEVNLLLDKVKDNDLLNIFVLLSLSTGGRLDTIVNIAKKDIDFSNGTIKLKDIKTTTSYDGFIKDDLIDILKDRAKDLKQNDYILNCSDVPIIHVNIQRKLKPILDELFNSELDSKDTKNRVVIHTLRHTFASLLVNNGMDIYRVQKLINHKDIATTQRYAKIDNETSRDIVNNIF